MPLTQTVGSDSVALNPRLVQEADKRKGDLSELVDQYAVTDCLPSTEWITRLSLVKPRRDVRCLSASTRFGKRALDILGASFLLIVMCPCMLLTALLVRLTSRGPVIFRQIRVGLNLRAKANPDRRQESAQILTEQDRRVGRDRRLDANYGKPFELIQVSHDAS